MTRDFSSVHEHDRPKRKSLEHDVVFRSELIDAILLSRFRDCVSEDDPKWVLNSAEAVPAILVQEVHGFRAVG